MPSRNIVWFGIAVFAIIAAGFFGAWLFAREVDPVLSETSGWDAARYIPGTLLPQDTSNEAVYTAEGQQPSGSLPVFTFASPIRNGNTNTREEELRAYLSGLSQGTGGEATSRFDFSGLFNFSFGNTISVTPQSDEQLALRAWANAAGVHVQTLGEQAAATNVSLSAFFENPNNETAAGVAAAASRLSDTAAGIEAIANTPDAIASASAALVAAYHNASDALGDVGEARSDEALFAAVTAYNEHASALGAAFVAVSDILKEKAVHFETSDAGNVFIFGS